MAGTDPIPPDGEERRQDLESRDRIDALELRQRRAVRFIYIAVLVVAAGVLVTGFGVLIAFDRLQESRIATLADACIRDSRQNRAVQGFVLARAPRQGAQRDALIIELNAQFPVIPETEVGDVCETRAERRANLK